MKHSLVTAYAYQKWKAGHRAMYLGKIFLDFIYLIGLSIPIVMDTLDFISLARNTNASSNSYSNLTAPGVPIRNIFVFITVMIMICGFSYILASGRRIILHFLKQTMFELFVAVLGLLYALPFNKPIGYENIRIGALLILCLFINVIFIMRSFSRLGLYISMLITTITTIIRVSVVFILLLVAFAGAFAIILNDEATFRQFDAALVTILTMSAGELNYANTFHHLINTGRLTGFKIELILFAAMVVIINIAFSNLLIGLAVGDINEVRETASLNLAKSQYESIIGIYESYPIYLKKVLYSPGLIVRKDKNSSYLQKQTWHSLTDNIAMIQEEKDQVNPEFDWRSLNAFVLRQQTEIRLLKESIEDVKSDIKMISYSSHSETNKLIKQVLHMVQANGNEKVTTTSAN
ncbi:Transient receptor potential cation channel subfamily A member 1 [Trichoplax sp. H2]|nr:Transient receptor potential cation channel subfamily A member 1 [Trichoplax sp. H2]|eukprot:RDD41698.1 Transient receptor potential cation channel subfamily A member 1 [Trichoplax sp. H2]